LLDETQKKLIAAQEAAYRLSNLLDKVRWQTEPLSTTLAMIEMYSMARRFAEEMNAHQEIIRATLGPIEDLRRATILGSEPSLGKEMSQIQQEVAAYEARFRFPDRSETTRLIAQVQNSGAIPFLSSSQEETLNLQRAIQAMKSPWLDAENTLHSIRGFAELQGIGQALRHLPTFDPRLADALRLELGDWRYVIDWPPHIFMDPMARTEFYIERGLNPGLTDFPAPAFKESLSIARLKEGPATKDNDEKQGFARTNAAHDRLQRFETQLRRFIDERMTAAFGQDWIKHQVPGDILKAWREKKQKAMDNGEQGWPLLAYADFTDYVPLIIRKDNWERVFKPIFQRIESVQESFQRLYPIRICTMHARIITQDDELYLYVEIKRILSVIDPG
jgi:Swt1-like HEPN